MKTTRPEADIEYSRGQLVSNRDSARRRGRRGTRRTGRSSGLRRGLLLAGLTGSALLVAAEFTPLLTVHSSASRPVIKTVQTGSHDSYALLPVAALALLLTLEVWRSRGRLALAATGVLGLVALLIALLGDLPDAQATGLVGNSPTTLRIAASTPAIGLYLETLGAVALLIGAGVGLLLLAPGDQPDSRRGLRARGTRTGATMTARASSGEPPSAS